MQLSITTILVLMEEILFTINTDIPLGQLIILW
ncbi:hypothetical protein Mgra_00010272 [Meloidogyne graminicola]|uniref:Uncharacterized protein n=1 Tax=Meloidogyne graminicola TaxID=189291 RepID=A0A8S9ZAN8_9BILA|nr:hypothetical protein Mgra_00010272 [Meloidogyne graminicola]